MSKKRLGTVYLRFISIYFISGFSKEKSELFLNRIVLSESKDVIMCHISES